MVSFYNHAKSTGCSRRPASTAWSWSTPTTCQEIPAAGQRPAGSECGDVRDRNDLKRTLRLEVTLSGETARCGASGSRLM